MPRNRPFPAEATQPKSEHSVGIDRLPCTHGEFEPGYHLTWRNATAQPVFHTTVRVRYAETDQMGVVYHSNYIVWFEVGRVEMLRQLGFSYQQMEKNDNVHIAVVDVRCRFKAPARYDDVIAIRTRLIHVRDSLLHFGYELARENDGTLLG